MKPGTAPSFRQRSADPLHCEICKQPITVQETLRRKAANGFAHVYTPATTTPDGAIAHVECLIAMHMIEPPDAHWLDWFFWFMRRERARAQHYKRSHLVNDQAFKAGE